MKKLFGRFIGITTSGLSGARKRAAESGAPAPTGQTTTPASDGAPDPIKGILEAFGKLTPEQQQALMDQMDQMGKATAAAMDAGASPEQAAKIASLQTELDAAKAQIGTQGQTLTTMKAQVDQLTQKLASGADSIAQKPGSETKPPEAKPARTFYGTLTALATKSTAK